MSFSIPLANFILRSKTLLTKEDFGQILSLLRGIFIRSSSPSSAGEFVSNFLLTRLSEKEKRKFKSLFKEDLLKSESSSTKEPDIQKVSPIPVEFLDKLERIKGERYVNSPE